jgi:hypothetical protein
MALWFDYKGLTILVKIALRDENSLLKSASLELIL